MIEVPRGTDLWHDIICDAIIITTNGDVNAQGRAVMGRGCALEATQLIPDISLRLARLITRLGNHVHLLCHLPSDGRPKPDPDIVSFPVKHHWHERADLKLIERSTQELVELARLHGWETVVMPRPGCGNGHLSWDLVRPILARYLDDRFVIVHK